MLASIRRQQKMHWSQWGNLQISLKKTKNKGFFFNSQEVRVSVASVKQTKAYREVLGCLPWSTDVSAYHTWVASASHRFYHITLNWIIWLQTTGRIVARIKPNIRLQKFPSVPCDIRNQWGIDGCASCCSAVFGMKLQRCVRLAKIRSGPSCQIYPVIIFFCSQ